MSSFWTGYHGSCLVMKRGELEEFLRKYCEVNNLDLEDTEDQIDDDGIREFCFLRSENTSETFEVTDILTDNCEGMFFSPYMINGEKNEGSNYQNYLFDEDLWVVFSDKDLDSAHAFFEMRYASYEAFVQEFKDKLLKYMPEDFDWEAHIGSLRYAAFA